MKHKRFIRKSPGALTLKQARFVSEYLKDLNATQAALRCGYSEKTARVQGARLLTNVAIAKAVAAGEAIQIEANKISAGRTLEETRRISYSSATVFFDAHGNFIPVAQWTPEMAAAVSRIEVVKKNVTAGDGHTDTVVKLWFWNKVQALELLFKHLGLEKSPVEDERPRVPVFIMPAGAQIDTQ